MKKAAAKTPAVVQINAFPYAEVSLGKRKLGGTPIRDLSLPPGTHRLKFENKELGLTKTKKVELKPGERRTIGVRLDK